MLDGLVGNESAPKLERRQVGPVGDELPDTGVADRGAAQINAAEVDPLQRLQALVVELGADERDGIGVRTARAILQSSWIEWLVDRPEAGDEERLCGQFLDLGQVPGPQKGVNLNGRSL